MYKSSNTFLCPAAVGFSVESDGDRRKQGLPSRLTFLNVSRSDMEYQFNGTLDLRSQKQENCIKILAKLKVKPTWEKRFFSSDLQEVIPLVCKRFVREFKTSYTHNWLNVLICESFQPKKSFIFFCNNWADFNTTVALMSAGQHQGQAAQHSHRGVFRNIGNQKTQVKERPSAAQAHTRCFPAKHRCCHGNRWDRSL